MQSKWGYGAEFGTDWLAGPFNDKDRPVLFARIGHHHDTQAIHVSNAHINIQEMCALFAAATRWSHLWNGCSIIFVTDSSTVESAIRTGRSKCSNIMHYLRCLFWLAVDNNFVFTTVCIKSETNLLSNALSRLNDPINMEKIRLLDKYNFLCCSDVCDGSIIFQRSKNCA